MNFFLQYAAGGFILGIIALRSNTWLAPHLPWFLGAGAVCLLSAIMLMAARRYAGIAILAAFACLGVLVTAHHLNISRDGHLAALIKDGTFDTVTEIHGQILGAPDQRERYTILPVTVDHLLTTAEDTIPVISGKLYVKVYPTFGEAYSRLEYGQGVVLKEVWVREPERATNPGSFDMRSFLNNQHFYGVVSVRDPEQLVVDPTQTGNPLIHAALAIRYNLLQTIRRTIPYPESSFLGGVLLGLRSGLSNEIKDTFRAAGVSHVLAVSGLHVTIITLFFMGIFAIIRMHRIPSFVLIVVALILFTLLTGARPSTVRACIMNSVTLVFFYFRGMKLDRSFLLGISAAALAILLMNPLVLTEASFLFSFSAVLSLSLLTRPLWELGCRYLKGCFRLVLFLELLTAIAVWLVDIRLFRIHWTWTVSALILLASAYAADRIFPKILEFRRLPLWFSTFAAAQMAIQLGMLPLTAFYFKKISVTAVMANFIAIPLIGVIVQLGLFAGILGQIPLIGLPLALTLNAANWIAIKLFLGTAHFFGTGFPYPSASPPRAAFLIPFYLGLLVFALQPWKSPRFRPMMQLLIKQRSNPAVKYRLAVIVLACALLAGNYAVTALHQPAELEVTFFDPVMFGMGGGNAVLVKTPGGFRMLMDTGPREVQMSQKWIDLDVCDGVIIPALLQKHETKLDLLVLSQAEHSYISGASSLIANRAFQIGKIAHAIPVSGDISTAAPDELLSTMNDPTLLYGKNLDHARRMADALIDAFHSAAEYSIPIARIGDGSILHTETAGGKNLSIHVINPPDPPFDGKYSTGSNSVAIEIVYGDAVIILTSAIDQKAQEYIVENTLSGAEAAVLQIPANGSKYALSEEFIETFQPLAAVLIPPISKYAKRSLDEVLDPYRTAGASVYRTDIQGAITVTTDGTTLRISGSLDPDRVEEFPL